MTGADDSTKPAPVIRDHPSRQIGSGLAVRRLFTFWYQVNNVVISDVKLSGNYNYVYPDASGGQSYPTKASHSYMGVNNLAFINVEIERFQGAFWQEFGRSGNTRDSKNTFFFNCYTHDIQSTHFYGEFVRGAWVNSSFIRSAQSHVFYVA